MRFDWDPVKATANKRVHGVSFEQAMLAFYDPFARIELDVDHSDAEDRYWHIGLTEAGLLVVTYAIRQPGNMYRIISARKADRKEREKYANYKRI